MLKKPRPLQLERDVDDSLLATRAGAFQHERLHELARSELRVVARDSDALMAPQRKPFGRRPLGEGTDRTPSQRGVARQAHRRSEIAEPAADWTRTARAQQAREASAVAQQRARPHAIGAPGASQHQGASRERKAGSIRAHLPLPSDDLSPHGARRGWETVGRSR